VSHWRGGSAKGRVRRVGKACLRHLAIGKGARRTIGTKGKKREDSKTWFDVLLFDPHQTNRLEGGKALGKWKEDGEGLERL